MFPRPFYQGGNLMSVLLSDRLNKSIREFEQEVRVYKLDPDSSHLDASVAHLKGAIITEIAIKNQEFRTEINLLKIALNDLRKSLRETK